jgi:hypothetical protein
LIVNDVFVSIFSVPEGHYKCPGCNAEGPIYFENSKRAKATFINSHDGELFLYSCCEKCEGTGYVDFVSNVMKNCDKIYWTHGYSLPTSAYDLSGQEIASTMFYLMYDKHNYLGFDIKFDSSINYKIKNEVNYDKLMKMIESGKNKEEVMKEFNFKTSTQLKSHYLNALMEYGKAPIINDSIKNKTNKRKILNFIEYFIEYKKDRDQRKIFIENNFDELRNSLLKITKINDLKKDQYICAQCNSQPFDIVHNTYFNEINLECCGKCYGQGVHSKRETQPIVGKYITQLEYPNYSNKKKMLNSILYNAQMERDVFVLGLGKIKYREQQLRKRTTITV